MTNKPKVLIFDVNETLLNLEGVRKSISGILKGGEEVISLWFNTMLYYALVDTVSDRYHNFGEIGAAALTMVAENCGIELDMEEARQVLNPIRTAPPHPEVPGALRHLSQKGFRMATLTNSSREGMETQLKNAQIDTYFDQCFSVEDIAMYKPHRHVYLWAARRLKAAPEDCLFIAAHGWDVAGAMAAGMEAAFISRPGRTLYPLAPKPAFVEPDLEALVQLLTRKL